jgi:hypothetical protein
MDFSDDSVRVLGVVDHIPAEGKIKDGVSKRHLFGAAVHNAHARHGGFPCRVQPIGEWINAGDDAGPKETRRDRWSATNVKDLVIRLQVKGLSNTGKKFPKLLDEFLPLFLGDMGNGLPTHCFQSLRCVPSRIRNRKITHQ